jgi:hypothetical protein
MPELPHPCASTRVRPNEPGGLIWRVIRKIAFRDEWILIRGGARITRTTQQLVDGWERVD